MKGGHLLLFSFPPKSPSIRTLQHRLTNEEIEALTSHNVELTRVVEQLSQSESVSEALQSLEAERNMLIRYVENDIPRRIESLEAERDAATRRVEEWRTKHEVQKEAATVRTAAAARQVSVYLFRLII